MFKLGGYNGIALLFWISNVILSPIRGQILISTACLSISMNIIVKIMVRYPYPYFYTADYVPVSYDFNMELLQDMHNLQQIFILLLLRCWSKSTASRRIKAWFMLHEFAFDFSFRLQESLLVSILLTKLCLV